MARVILPGEIADQFAGGARELDVTGETIRQVIRGLEKLYPGIGAILETRMSVAIDGEFIQDAFLEPVGPDSEVCFLPVISGG